MGHICSFPNSVTMILYLKYHIYAVGGFGNLGNGLGTVATIYGLNKSEEWEHVDDLKQARKLHLTINMKLKDIPGCQ